jgi:O-antigen/teichoic acid export membrane protein
MKALRALGMDGAVTYAFLARLTSIVGSVGTVLLIVRFLSPVEQGYYYTLLSLVSLQVVFELGFSFVIQQLAAHECIRLELGHDGSVRGDPQARARLASVLRLSVCWYTIAALAMAMVLAPLGVVFFSRCTAVGQAHIAWQGPWLAVVLASSTSLWCMPFYSFLEGCGHVRAVAAMRFRQAIAAALFAWAPLLVDRGLYSPALVIVGQIVTGLLYVATHRRLLTSLLRLRSCAVTIDWMREVWPFQWRIAVSWMCSYFTAQVFIPILFALRGPVEAGQLGMSLSITGYMVTLALVWTSTKSTPFGNLIARRAFQQLDQLFRRALGQSLMAFAAIAIAACAGAALLPFFAPRLAARLVSPPIFAVLVLAAGANCAIQSLATLLRSFKTEPFLVQSLIAAALTLAFAALTTSRWGNAGAALSYLVATAGFALPSALTILARARRGYLVATACASCGDETGCERRSNPSLSVGMGLSYLILQELGFTRGRR